MNWLLREVILYLDDFACFVSERIKIFYKLYLRVIKLLGKLSKVWRFVPQNDNRGPYLEKIFPDPSSIFSFIWFPRFEDLRTGIFKEVAFSDFYKLEPKIDHNTLLDAKFYAIPEFRKGYNNFLDFFKNFKMCPLCYAENHTGSLSSFYFSQNPELIVLKQQLLGLLRIKKFSDKISLGIPCCDCYTKFFADENGDITLIDDDDEDDIGRIDLDMLVNE